ncbi:efflux RND transporter periplasmic adaptor subunit [Thalassobius vesicularis]|uniref:Efflux RND transporter periplasmic adaptor subunit n=1 Tax=Thalassobius vesicularis TaxID=1294297 RepID=A0A4S3MB59_9RHOB|nr:efflux RND transporter periplasmic adaptor subunit [Thalassobius vesicularis]THD75704.1 efflux RND transporter periplasmic adaptor subunit [Thalassobius vesicularis]
MKRLLTAAALGLLPLAAFGETEFVLQPTPQTEWKAVYGRIEARDRVPARARIGGTLTELNVSEGDLVSAGQALAVIVDEKLTFQLSAIDAQLLSLNSQLENAKTELKRGEELLARGVTTVQRMDALRTQVDVLEGQIEATQANRRVVEQQTAEGTVLAPAAGRVLDVPVTKGAVLMPGEAVATVGGGGFFLRLAIPERHATALTQGAEIEIEAGDAGEKGTLVRIYPQIENGRVVADVEVTGLSDAFVDARVLVRIPVGTRDALVIPAEALLTRSGLDFVAVKADGETSLRTVVPGDAHDGKVEILTGLNAGDVVVTGYEGASHE